MSNYQTQTIDQLKSGKLSGTKHLKLLCNLTEFPREILDLADTLEVLDLSGNKLSALPTDVASLKRLKIIFLSDNEFTEFPSVLGRCAQLDIIGFKANKIKHIAEEALPLGIRWLILTNNQLTQLPESIGNCTNLQKLMLAGNQLAELPDTMIQCKKLELLRISANHFDKLPAWLLSLPRLSWLALGGNPMTKPSEERNQLREIPWREIEPEQILGEGASGVISKAYWRTEEAGHEVAIKIFKGEVTSDGLPSDEMNTCIAAGSHANLVRVLGKIVEHPQQKQGLAFALIDRSFTNLGGPPDFKTCTRDTFKPETEFTAQQVIQIATGIASAMAHLHERSITHGDLYAHNILVDQQSSPLLSDFGAAYLYNSGANEYAPALARIETRAFGCLLEDLIYHIDRKDKQMLMTESLIQLQRDCMQETVMHRPDFATIHKRMKSMRAISNIAATKHGHK